MLIDISYRGDFLKPEIAEILKTIRLAKSDILKKSEENSIKTKMIERNLSRPIITLGHDTISIEKPWDIVITVENGRLTDYNNFPEIEGFKKLGTKSRSLMDTVNGQFYSSQSIIMYYQALRTGFFTISPFIIKINEDVIFSPGKSIVVIAPN